MAIAQHRHLVLQAGQRALHILIGVGRQCLLQMLGHAVVVHHDAATLAETGTIYAGNGLQQLCLTDRPVEVHYTFDWRIEAGEQHRLHDQEGKRVSLFRLGIEQRLLEALDQLLVCRTVGPLLPCWVVVVAARNNRSEFDAR
ncbi:hypothetical protein D3C73_725810 [compost metagenome]